MNGETPPEERVLCIRELRYGSSGKLEQKLLIVRGGVEVEEWREVSGSPSIHRQINPKIDWTTVDWTQRNTDLASDLGYSPAYICCKRKVFGFRREFENRRPTGGIVSSPKIITQEMIDGAKWQEETDSMLARGWGVSRERVRQLRIIHKKPECLFKHAGSNIAKVQKWIEDHRAELTGKHIHEVVRMAPFPCETGVISRQVRRCGLDVIWGSAGWVKTNTTLPEEINWAIPNIFLTSIWKAKIYVVAGTRSRYKHGPPKWFEGGKNRPHHKNPEFIAVINAEIEKAKARGIVPDEKRVQEQLAAR